MNSIRTFLLLIIASVFCFAVTAQNVSLNLLTQNSGLVSVGGTVNLEVTVCNTDGAVSVPVYKLRPQISVPAAIASIPVSGHTLPAGWNIVSNSGTVVRLTNGTDQIPANTCRTILIQVQGNTIGGPSTISGNMLFSNGSAPGSASGSATAGDNPSDNSSTSTVQVTTVTPVKLTDFNAAVIQCKPMLKWNTLYEQNSYSFEIQRSRNSQFLNWEPIGSLPANGNSIVRTAYTYTDNNLYTGNEKILYRLKSVDRDGRFTYSDVLPVSLNCSKREVSIFPNPSKNGRFQISLTGNDKNTEIRLISAQGQIIRRMNLIGGTTGLEVSQLAAGTYFLQVLYNDGTSLKKTVVISQ